MSRNSVMFVEGIGREDARAVAPVIVYKSGSGLRGVTMFAKLKHRSCLSEPF